MRPYYVVSVITNSMMATRAIRASTTSPN